jgi:hypothetical protein
VRRVLDQYLASVISIGVVIAAFASPYKKPSDPLYSSRNHGIDGGSNDQTSETGGAVCARQHRSHHQTLENQIHELTQIAERRGWEVVEMYKDHGISGAKGRDKRPGLDLMLTDASRRKFDVVMSWAIDRVGRSLTRPIGHNSAP